jgi:predicted amidohydrolase YtcJ
MKSILPVLLATLMAGSAATQAFAHGPGGHGPRPRIGASHLTPTGSPEDWGTYCVTELAPLFREALALNPAITLASAATQAAAQEAGRAFPLLDPLPPSLSTAPVARTDGITVYVAKKIVTMDPGWPEATAVAVKDGRIMSVGTMEDLKPWLDKFPFTVDETFKDKIIYPGFVEAHGHPIMGGVAVGLRPLSYFPLKNPYGEDFPGVSNRAEAFERLKKYVAEAGSPTETILTWGYDVVAMGGEFPTREELDEISATHPIVIWDASEHYVFANSAAIETYGVTPEMVKNTIGAGARPDGSSNGQFLGTEAAKIIILKPLASALTPEGGMRALRHLGALMQQAGVTTTGDLFYGGVSLPLEEMLTRQFFGSENGIARVVVVADGVSFTGIHKEEAVSKAIELRAGSNERIMFNGVKFYSDDAFLSLGMEMQWPGYVNPETYKGLFMFNSKSDFVSAMRPWWNAGFQIHVHSNGSGGNQITLDALAELQAETPRFDHRFTFEHFGISTTAQGRQLKALGALVSTNPYYVSQRADFNAAQIGTDRASLAARMASLIDQDVVVSLHSDTPVGVPSPLTEVWTAVNRIGLVSGKVHAPAERVSDVMRAMKMVTIDAAYTLGVNDRVGSIESGKFADFTVLDDDPLEVDPMKIKDIRVHATILAGKPTLTSATRDPNW